MKRRMLVIAGVVAMALAAATPVFANGTPPGECVVPAIQAAAGGSEGTIGDGISDGYYGNEPNIIPFVSGSNQGPEETDPGSLGPGSVVGSSAPGPWTADPPQPGDRTHDFGDGPRPFGTPLGVALTAVCNP